MYFPSKLFMQADNIKCMSYITYISAYLISQFQEQTHTHILDELQVHNLPQKGVVLLL